MGQHSLNRRRVQAHSPVLHVVLLCVLAGVSFEISFLSFCSADLLDDVRTYIVRSKRALFDSVTFGGTPKGFTLKQKTRLRKFSQISLENCMGNIGVPVDTNENKRYLRELEYVWARFDIDFDKESSDSVTDHQRKVSDTQHTSLFTKSKYLNPTN